MMLLLFSHRRAVLEVFLLTVLFVFDSSSIPPQYLTGDLDPPLCHKVEFNPFPGQCGQRLEEHLVKRDLFSSDIIGGRAARRGEFPWFADFGGCGGTVVDSLHVVTAAHCRPERKINQLILVGSDIPYRAIKTSTKFSDYCGIQVRKIVAVRSHPDFCSKSLYDVKQCEPWMNNDISVITLNRKLIFNKRVQPVCLPTMSGHSTLTTTGTVLDAVGNGFLNYETRETPNVLQTVRVPVVDWKTCKAWMSNAVSETMLCAGFTEGGKDACIGDSGGPLFHIDEEKATFVGVISWGVDCAKAKAPGVYTRVDAFIDFIRQDKHVFQADDDVTPPIESVASFVSMGFSTWTLPFVAIILRLS